MRAGPVRWPLPELSSHPLSPRYSGRDGPHICRTGDGGRAAGLPTLAADRPQPGSPKEAAVNRIQRIRRLAGVLAGLACALVAFAAAAPAALASVAPPPGGAADAAVPLQFLPPGWNNHPPPPAPMRVHTHTIVIHTVTPGGGMPGWQITLIVGGAALLA